MFLVPFCLVWSGRFCSLCYKGHVVFPYLTVCFWFATSFESLNHHFVITSGMPVFVILSRSYQSAFNLTMFRFPFINAPLVVSSLRKVMLIKCYKVAVYTFFLSIQCLQAITLERRYLIEVLIYPLHKAVWILFCMTSLKSYKAIKSQSDLPIVVFSSFVHVCCIIWHIIWVDEDKLRKCCFHPAWTASLPWFS